MSTDVQFVYTNRLFCHVCRDNIMTNHSPLLKEKHYTIRRFCSKKGQIAQKSPVPEAQGSVSIVLSVELTGVR